MKETTQKETHHSNRWKEPRQLVDRDFVKRWEGNGGDGNPNPDLKQPDNHRTETLHYSGLEGKRKGFVKEGGRNRCRSVDLERGSR